ncbi:MAG TPA: hypothetical protein VF541_11650 [Longimicrobium sp.]
MKKKLSLRIEALNVDSFVVPGNHQPEGTVRAYDSGTTEDTTCATTSPYVCTKMCTRYISCGAYTC